jgi:hypothetical protein
LLCAKFIYSCVSLDYHIYQTKSGGKFMKTETTSAYSDLPTVLNAIQLAKTLGISRAGAYNLLASKGFPTLHIGNRKLAKRKTYKMD